MLIICSVDDSHEMSRFVFSEKMSKLSVVAVVIGALRVNIGQCQTDCIGWQPQIHKALNFANLHKPIKA